jgi:two-component sensor histidine kinase
VPLIDKQLVPSLRIRLLLLVSSAILPLAFVTVTTTYYLSRAYDDVASSRLLSLSRSILNTVEARLLSIETAEDVLANSIAIQENNLEMFRQSAKSYLERFMPAENFVLSDLNETQLINTAAAEAIGKRTNTNPAILEAHRKVKTTGRTVISSLLHGQVIKQFAIGVETPVFINGHLTYILGMPVTSDALSNLLADQQFDPRWTVAILDREGKVVARVPQRSDYIGRQASPSIITEIGNTQDKVITSTTFEGVDVSTAVAHSPKMGLTLALGIPRDVMTSPWVHALYSIIAFSALCFITSAYAATRLASKLLEAEHTRSLLIHELNHRIGNLLATVQGITQQTFRLAQSKEDAGNSIQSRIMALARVSRILTDADWRRTSLSYIIKTALEPYYETATQIEIKGRDTILVSPKTAQAVTLAINELATNALKYGALSSPLGKIHIDLAKDSDSTILLSWEESGGPTVLPPKHQGFGSVLLRGLGTEFGAAVYLDYIASGLICKFRIRND